MRIKLGSECSANRISHKPLGLVLLVLMLSVIFVELSPCLSAQEVTAGITGTISDPSGAPIPNAKVTATDTARGVPYTTQTNEVGVFDLPRLPIGTYDVTIEAQGFSTLVQRGIILQLNQRARVNLQLKVGTITQTVEVAAAAPVLQTDTMQVGTAITGKLNVDLPLPTRNYIELTLLAPGVNNPNPGSLENGMNTGSGGRPYVNGNREQSDNFLLDGLDNNQVSDNLVGYTPSMDAIQETNLITNNAPAEFGNFQGGIVSATIKSGTNQLHGDGFEFFRNDVLNAANWGGNLTGNPKGKMRWNMFGGTIGGPIKKDKIFFFGDYQGQRYDFPASSSAITVFTNKERAGDFSEICQTGFDATGHCLPAPADSGLLAIQLYNPASTYTGPCGPPATQGGPPTMATCRNIVPNNNLAAAGLTIDPVAAKLFAASYYPAPNNGNLRFNQVNTSRSEIIGDQFDVKIDANLTDDDRLSGRASWSRQNNPGFNSFPLFYNSFNNAPTKSLVLDWTRTITPTLVNDVRVGGNYVKQFNGGADNGLGNVGQDLGIAGANDRGPGLPALQGFAYVNTIGSSNIGVQQNFPSTVLQADDTLVITHGKHIIHTGFQFFRQRINPFYAGNYGRTGIINFDGQFTAGPAAASSSGGGAGFQEADFWLGLPDYVQRGVDTGDWGQRSSIIAAYGQDSWRATENLTVNFGLRYETHTPWIEVYNRQANFGSISGTEYIAGQSCPWSNCRALYNSYNAGFDFQPRLGFAWTPSFLSKDKKTVIRGAFTVSSYLEGTGTNLRLPLNPPFNLEHNAIYDPFTYPKSTTDQGFTIFTAPANPFDGAVIRLWNPDIKPSLAQQWNLSVEHQFTPNTTLTVGYIGQNATHLMNPMPYFQRRLVGEAGCTQADATDWAGTGVLTCASPYLSGNPQLAGISQISGTESNADMWYHAMQATLLKRFSNGLQYQVAYTYSHCMSNSIGYYGSWGGQVVPTAAYWQNLYDAKAEWAPCENDVRHKLSSYVVYELPFGHKKHFGSSWNSVTNGVLGGWQVSGIIQEHGGYPSTAFANNDGSGTGERTSRADCLGPTKYPKTPVVGGVGIQWVDPSSYGPQQTGQFGTCGVGTMIGPGLHTIDLTFQKSIPVSESKHIEFRSEFINFANTPILNAPGVWLGGGFGQITSSQGERNIQFGLKFYY